MTKPANKIIVALVNPDIFVRKNKTTPSTQAPSHSSILQNVILALPIIDEKLLVTLLKQQSTQYSQARENGKIDHGGCKILRLSCVADTDGSFSIAIPDDAIHFILGMELDTIKVEVGATAPTANSDLAITDPDVSGTDLLGGDAANIVTTSDAVVVLTPAVLVYDAFVITVTNNIVDSATFEIFLICKRV